MTFLTGFFDRSNSALDEGLITKHPFVLWYFIKFPFKNICHLYILISLVADLVYNCILKVVKFIVF
jgi:hypothetical protein